jgi:two-component system response regulator WspF
VRIAIVNDVLMAVEAVRRVILSTREHEVAWTALDGAEAVQRCAADRPDLILMDLIMPRMDGVEATRRIMSATPCAIVVVTANVHDNCARVFDAMGAGALDAVNTPVMEETEAAVPGKALLAKVATIGKLLGAKVPARMAPATEIGATGLEGRRETLVVMGASAGGPAALAQILSTLPGDFPAPVVIVQHVDVQFVRGLAEWLGAQTPLRVRLAEAGDRPVAGVVLLAGVDQHMALTPSGRLVYQIEPADCSYRPSVDVLFKSVRRYWTGEVIGVLLTGMGRDGAAGLKSLNVMGHHTIAQDRESSAVYGMPKAAVDLNGASEVLSLNQIGPRLCALVAQKSKVNG